MSLPYGGTPVCGACFKPERSRASTDLQIVRTRNLGTEPNLGLDPTLTTGSNIRASPAVEPIPPAPCEVAATAHATQHKAQSHIPGP